MKTTIDTYPVFDANQVLTNDHLNMVVNYLEEQERLTRANLVGIGISCGLALTVDGAAGKATFTRGCAVTSLGYLIVEPNDVALTGYREYELPEGDAYAPFMDGDEQLPIWELFPDGEPNVTKLSIPSDFLKDKAVLLFVERDDEDLSDCSPSNCDDKGSEVTVTVRRLLVNASDVEQISATLEAEKLAAAQQALPTLRLNRYDTPATGPTTTREILVAFQDQLRKDDFVSRLSKALRSAYSAFRPVLRADYPTAPFSGFTTRYGFLETTPTDSRQVKFLQYYTDLFADLVAGYDEFRRKGLELTCLCCPPEDWFPRHVVLGPQRRTAWYPASASGCGCESLRAEVRALFKRLVQMSLRFTNQPALAESSSKSGVDGQIRITPSRAGTAPLSDRCIPYYFEFTGSPKLYELWNPALTAAGNADHNLAYRSFEYATTPPAFVTSALAFDLEPFDFLRIEGHLGKDYRAVLGSLLATRDAFRLPFDVVVACTGDVNDSVEVDPAEHECRFQDLEATYDVLRAELICLATKAFTSLGQTKLPTVSTAPKFMAIAAASSPVASSGLPSATATYSSSKAWSAALDVMGVNINDAATTYGFGTDSIGAILISNAKDWGQFEFVHPGWSMPTNTAVSVLAKLIALTSTLAADLALVDWDAFDAICDQLDKLSQIIDKEAASDGADGPSWQELNQQLVSVVYACNIEGFGALRDEYERRLEELRKLAFFGSYAQQHPGLQHKAGVPVGGTFLLVYHGASKATKDSKSDAYDTTIEQFAEGTVVADFFLPYRCCSDCAPIQYVIKQDAPPQVEPPVIAASMGCTSAKDGAEVQFVVTGGTEPYELVVGGDDQGSMTGTLVLKLFPGSYTVQASDADGLSATPITLVVPEALSAGAVAYVDDSAAGTYTASFTVAGGVGPCGVSTGALAGNVVTVAAQKSGTGADVVITDSVGCSITVAIEHTVENLCDKPCEGKALRGHFPAWAPRPAASTSYQYKAFKAWKVTITDETGKTILSEDYAEQVSAVVMSQQVVTESTYRALMTKVCATVSDAIDSRLAAQYGSGAFSIGFDAKSGTLLMEWYACHAFIAELDFLIVGKFDNRSEHWSYVPEGVHVSQQSGDQSTTYAMPIFGRIDLDKCANTVGKDCAVAVKSILATTKEEALILSVVFGQEASVKDFDFYWRIETPTLGFSRNSEVKLPAAKITALRADVLIVEKQTRCWFYGEKTFTFSSGTSPNG